ncbi:MAG: hypothetical protein K8R92_01285 [Planctomycetes bacterium]|nr:hypothetical protein [Planctomycetota bacterium]
MFFPFITGATAQDTAATQNTAENAQREARSAQSRLESLQCDVERLSMITEALWVCLKQQHGYKDEDLAKLVKEIELRDGKLDGHAAPPEPRACPHCGRMLAKRRPACYYCGKPVEVEPFAR